MSEFTTALEKEFAPYAPLSSQQLDLLDKHYQLMLQWNRRLNLTRITEVKQAVQLHYCEGLFLGTFVPPAPLNIADLGSGAGFPGIPVAVLRPDCTVTLIESDQRKAVFLREASRGLANVKVVAARSEDVSGRYDLVIARAVRKETVLESGLAPKFLFLGSEEFGVSHRVPWGENHFVCSVG